MRGVVISSRTCRTSSRGLLTVSRRSSSNCRWPLDSFVRPDTCRWSKGSHEVSEDAPTRSPSAFPQLPKGLRPGLRVSYKDLFVEAIGNADPATRRSLLFWVAMMLFGVAIWFVSSLFSGRR